MCERRSNGTLVSGNRWCLALVEFVKQDAVAQLSVGM